MYLHAVSLSPPFHHTSFKTIHEDLRLTTHNIILISNFKGKGGEKSREKTTKIKVSADREVWQDKEKNQVARTT